MSEPVGIVVVIDDDLGIREAVSRLLQAAGIENQTFPSAEAFLESGMLADTAVLILDIQLPGISGPALQQQLLAAGSAPPAIFITAQDLPHHREGAAKLDSPYFSKPFPGKELIEAVRERLAAV